MRGDDLRWTQLAGNWSVNAAEFKVLESGGESRDERLRENEGRS